MRDKEVFDGRTAKLSAMYLRRHMRGQHLSDLFYSARANWAAEKGYEELSVQCVFGNHATQNIVQRWGFERIGSVIAEEQSRFDLLRPFHSKSLNPDGGKESYSFASRRCYGYRFGANVTDVIARQAVVQNPYLPPMP